jgi:transcriptional regulator with XRE-family HTH domain
MDDQTMGQRIKKRREELQISLTQLSEKSGVAKGYLWELENEKSDKDVRPSAGTVFKIAEALGTSAADLLGKKIQQTSKPEIPNTLKQFAEAQDLTEADVEMLARIEFRGEKPETQDDWQYIYESIRRTILGKGKKGEQAQP